MTSAGLILGGTGGTGGFRAWWRLEKDSGRAVIVLSNTTRDGSALGKHLLAGNGQSSVKPDSPGAFGWVLVICAVPVPAVPLLKIRQALARRTTDHLLLLRQIADVIATLAITRVVVDWSLAPLALWSAGVALGFLLIVGMAWVWKQPSCRFAVSGWRRSFTIAYILIAVTLAVMAA